MYKLHTDIANGYVAFVVSIIGIGLLTAVIGDLASHLGCTVGIKDSVTAIAFVALGTSIPGKIQQNHKSCIVKKRQRQQQEIFV